MKKLIPLLAISCYKSNLTIKNKTFNESIKYYISECNSGAVVKLISNYKKANQNFDLNLLDDTGQAPIHLAASLGEIDIIKELIINNADVNLQNALGETALHIATEMGYEDLTDYLLSIEVDTNINDSYGTNPLIANLTTGNCSLEILKKLLINFNVNQEIGQERKTILHFVCEKANLDCVEFLISKGSLINKKDAAGNTPLHLLFRNVIEPLDLDRINEIITSSNANLNLKNNSFKTVQDIAIERNIEPLINFLHNKGLDRFEIENSNINMLIRSMNSYGNIDLDDFKTDTIKDNLEVLFIKGEDFNVGDASFLKILAATFYANWTKDNFKTALPERIQLDNNFNINEAIDVDHIINLINNVDKKQLDIDVRANFGDFKNRFLGSVNEIKNNRYTNPETCKVAKMKLKKLCSILPSIKSDKGKNLFIINTLLRQFYYCSVGAITGLDQALLYVDTDSEKDFEKNIHILLERERKNALLETIRQVCPGERQQVHFDHLVIRDFADELKIVLEYNDPYPLDLNVVNINYDKDAVRAEFNRRYNVATIINILKSKLSFAPTYDYLKELSGNRNIHLTEDDEIFFNDNYEIKDELIKGILIYLGYIKSSNL